MRTITLLDLRLGLVELTPDQLAELRRHGGAFYRRVTERLIREEAARPPVDEVAAGKQEE